MIVIKLRKKVAQEDFVARESRKQTHRFHTINHGLTLTDPIYTGKMLFGILDLVKKDMFSEGTKILAIHTGGIQGIQGINHQLENKNQELIKVLWD